MATRFLKNSDGWSHPVNLVRVDKRGALVEILHDGPRHYFPYKNKIRHAGTRFYVPVNQARKAR